MCHEEEDPVREWKCPWCNYPLHARRSRKEIDCPNCTATLDLGGKAQETKTIEDPNKTKAASNEVYVATTPDPVNPWEKRPIEPKGAFAELQKKGIHITYYEERDGSGKIISWKREEDE